MQTVEADKVLVGTHQIVATVAKLELLPEIFPLQCDFSHDDSVRDSLEHFAVGTPQ